MSHAALSLRPAHLSGIDNRHQYQALALGGIAQLTLPSKLGLAVPVHDQSIFAAVAPALAYLSVAGDLSNIERYHDPVITRLHLVARTIIDNPALHTPQNLIFLNDPLCIQFFDREVARQLRDLYSTHVGETFRAGLIESMRASVEGWEAMSPEIMGIKERPYPDKEVVKSPRRYTQVLPFSASELQDGPPPFKSKRIVLIPAPKSSWSKFTTWAWLNLPSGRKDREKIDKDALVAENHDHLFRWDVLNGAVLASQVLNMLPEGSIPLGKATFYPDKIHRPGIIRGAADLVEQAFQVPHLEATDSADTPATILFRTFPDFSFERIIFDRFGRFVSKGEFIGSVYLNKVKSITLKNFISTQFMPTGIGLGWTNPTLNESGEIVQYFHSLSNGTDLLVIFENDGHLKLKITLQNGSTWILTDREKIKEVMRTGKIPSWATSPAL